MLTLGEIVLNPIDGLCTSKALPLFWGVIFSRLVLLLWLHLKFSHTSVCEWGSY